LGKSVKKEETICCDAHCCCGGPFVAHQSVHSEKKEEDAGAAFWQKRDLAKKKKVSDLHLSVDTKEGCEQGDQIGRMFAHWGDVYFYRFF
jgi:hypothetical protein